MYPAAAMPANFRRRCELALTHPMTMGALVVLLVNDWVLKPLWQSDWTTGKLSDLAWVVFASPLLAFLLSRLTRGHRLAERGAFSIAYVGLPLLYAAFNTFEPLHDLILSVLLFVGGGSVGSPFDPTDSVVIPFGIAVAGWVWHRSGTDDGALRARCCLLVAIVASISSVASSCSTPPPMAWHVGIMDDGATFVVGPYGGYSHYSHDGGLTWQPRIENGTSPVERDQTFELGTAEVATPRGTYAIRKSSIVRLASNGEDIKVHDTGYLQEGSNMWAQGYRTREIRGELTSCDDEERLLTTGPLNITYHPGTGNVIAAMGLEGVLVGSPNEEWRRVAVGDLVPTDFSLASKARMAFSTYFWLTALAVSFCLVTAALVLSPRDFLQVTDTRPTVSSKLGILVRMAPLLVTWVLGTYLLNFFLQQAIASLILLAALLIVTFFTWRLWLRNSDNGAIAPMLLVAVIVLAFLSVYTDLWTPSLLAVTLIPFGAIALLFLLWLALPGKVRALISVILGVVLSCLAFPPFGPVYFWGGDMTPALGIAGLVFALMGSLSYLPPRQGWTACVVAVVVMLAAIAIPFSIWLQGYIPITLAAVLSLGLLVFTAYRLSRYLTDRMPSFDPPPPWRAA